MKTKFFIGDKIAVAAHRRKAGFKIGEVIKGPYRSTHDNRKHAPADYFTVGFHRTVSINMDRRRMTKVQPGARIT